MKDFSLSFGESFLAQYETLPDNENFPFFSLFAGSFKVGRKG
jgi:hypothetical protein